MRPTAAFYALLVASLMMTQSATAKDGVIYVSLVSLLVKPRQQLPSDHIAVIGYLHLSVAPFLYLNKGYALALDPTSRIYVRIGGDRNAYRACLDRFVQVFGHYDTSSFGTPTIFVTKIVVRSDGARNNSVCFH